MGGTVSEEDLSALEGNWLRETMSGSSEKKEIEYPWARSGRLLMSKENSQDLWDQGKQPHQNGPTYTNYKCQDSVPFYSVP